MDGFGSYEIKYGRMVERTELFVSARRLRVYSRSFNITFPGYVILLRVT
jgi:hypothetical protein